MADVLLIAAAQLCSFTGMGWLALAMKVHWQQVRGAVPLPPPTRTALRISGASALALALLACAGADPLSMAALVWIMGLAASALAVAFVLAWRPRWLLWLAPWTSSQRRV